MTHDEMMKVDGGGYDYKSHIIGTMLNYAIERIVSIPTTPYKVTKRRNGKSYEVEYNGNWSGK